MVLAGEELTVGVTRIRVVTDRGDGALNISTYPADAIDAESVPGMVRLTRGGELVAIVNVNVLHTVEVVEDPEVTRAEDEASAIARAQRQARTFHRGSEESRVP